jgi:hypothetical protein
MMKPLPERLSIGIGGHFGPSFNVEWDGQSMTYTQTKRRKKEPWEFGSSEEWEAQSEQIQPSDERWHAFRAALDRLSVWSWQQRYTDPEVCDGTGWSIEISYADKAIVSGGSNCFPNRSGAPISITKAKKGDTFDRFCGAVSALLDRDFR